MNILKQVPNWFTLANLSCGVLAILNIFQGQLQVAAYLVILALIFDFFDGFLARLFKVSGELGKQLDSLADMVTFGVAPAFVLYSLSEDISGIWRFSFLLLSVFSAYRLAKFNIDKRQSHGFIGVPTPITGIMCMSWVFIDSDLKLMIFQNPLVYILFCVLVSVLLISEIHLPSLKLKRGPWQSYSQHIFLALVALFSLIFYTWLAVPIFYATYVLSSILFNFAKKKLK